MVTTYELANLAEETIIMASYAKASEVIDEISADQKSYASEEARTEAMKAALSDESLASYREDFECIARWLSDLSGIEEGGTDVLAASFDQIVTRHYGKLELDDKGEFVGAPDFELMEEHTRLYGVIVQESIGESFDVFAEEFLVPLPRMWQYQSAIVATLGESATLTNNLYNRAREDAAALAKEAKNEFARLAGYGDKTEGAELILGLLGLVVGLVGFVPAAATAAGVVGTFLSVVGLLNKTPPPKEAPKSETVSGDTAIGVRDSLNFALDDHVLIPLRDGEVKMFEALTAINDFVEDPATRANLIARDLSFPK